jgi:glycosyltransferase involved in cell wall biosynthesis
VRFSIITPSFRNSSWLKLCIASVNDQGVPLEHIVQDAGSDDGTLEWLLQDKRVRAFVEKDQGMYDGVNRGMRRATGDILAYLNCDEQYLPGALARVRDYFNQHPEMEVVFADAIVVDSEGEYLCHRQASLPLKYHTLVSNNLAILTCAAFFRNSVVAKHGLLFNPKLKTAGDAEWILSLIERRVRMGLLTNFTSVFTETGTNLDLSPHAQLEKRALFNSAPSWVRWCRHLFVAHYRCSRLLAGHYYRTKPFAYSLFTMQSPQARVMKKVSKPKFRWVRRG